MPATSLLPFVAAVVLMWLSPGPALTVLLRTATLRGLSHAVATTVGLEIGLYFWAIAAAAGAAALVAASEVAFVVLRVGGAVVLILLGIKAWRSASRAHGREPSLTGQGGRSKAFGNGLLVQLANPKTATLLIAFYPQFVPSGRPLLATTAELALLQVMIESVLYLAVAIAVSRAGDWFRRPAIRRRLEAVSGTVLIGLGIRVAVLSR
jgi:threonine/homoserine/homoserine lactone efflux protein